MIDIIIPTKGKLDYLFKCLNQIKEYTKVDYHVYVADTGSTDKELQEIAEMLKHLFGDKKNAALYMYDYYNFAKINNDVVKNTNGEWLLFCNNDVFLQCDCIGPMLSAAKKYEERVGTIGCRLMYPNKTIQHAGQICLLDIWGNFCVTHRGIGTQNRYPDGEVMGNTGALMLTSRKRFEEIGGFNEKYNECFEDVEYNLECVKRGYKNGYLDSVEAIHAESQTRGKKWDALNRVTRDYDVVLRPYWKQLPFNLQQHILQISGHI